jgi:far upstream element-binding protein
VAVPRAAVGVVIGKGGDMIKKIQSETGARVQFQQGRDDGPGERRCLLTGKPSQVEQARRRIEDLIDSVLVCFILRGLLKLISNLLNCIHA